MCGGPRPPFAGRVSRVPTCLSIYVCVYIYIYIYIYIIIIIIIIIYIYIYRERDIYIEREREIHIYIYIYTYGLRVAQSGRESTHGSFPIGLVSNWARV